MKNLRGAKPIPNPLIRRDITNFSNISIIKQKIEANSKYYHVYRGKVRDIYKSRDELNKYCENISCNVANPLFNIPGSKNGKFCKLHKTPGMIDFLKHTKEFIDEAVFWNGHIPLKGTHRVLHGFLTNKRGIVCDVTLKYVKEED